MSVVLAENRIQQQVFHTQRVNSSVEITRGHAVVITGFAPRRNANIGSAIDDTPSKPQFNPNLQHNSEPPRSSIYLIETEFVE